MNPLSPPYQGEGETVRTPSVPLIRGKEKRRCAGRLLGAPQQLGQHLALTFERPTLLVERGGPLISFSLPPRAGFLHPHRAPRR